MVFWHFCTPKIGTRPHLPLRYITFSLIKIHLGTEDTDIRNFVGVMSEVWLWILSVFLGMAGKPFTESCSIWMQSSHWVSVLDLALPMQKCVQVLWIFCLCLWNITIKVINFNKIFSLCSLSIKYSLKMFFCFVWQNLFGIGLSKFKRDLFNSVVNL